MTENNFFTIFYLDISWLLHSLLDRQQCWCRSYNGAAGRLELLFRNIHANLAKPACNAREQLSAAIAAIESTMCCTDTKVTIITICATPQFLQSSVRHHPSPTIFFQPGRLAWWPGKSLHALYITNCSPKSGCGKILFTSSE